MAGIIDMSRRLFGGARRPDTSARKGTAQGSALPGQEVTVLLDGSDEPVTIVAGVEVRDGERVSVISDDGTSTVVSQGVGTYDTATGLAKDEETGYVVAKECQRTTIMNVIARLVGVGQAFMMAAGAFIQVGWNEEGGSFPAIHMLAGGAHIGMSGERIEAQARGGKLFAMDADGMAYTGEAKLYPEGMPTASIATVAAGCTAIRHMGFAVLTMSQYRTPKALASERVTVCTLGEGWRPATAQRTVVSNAYGQMAVCLVDTTGEVAIWSPGIGENVELNGQLIWPIAS